MGNFDNAIPRGSVPISTEISRLASRHESGSADHSWKRIQASNHRNDQVTRSLSQIQRQLAGMQANDQSLSGFHPFKIYQFPSHMRVFHPTDEPYRVKVRTGCVNTPQHGGLYGTGYVDGTDFNDGYVNATRPAPIEWEIYTAIGYGIEPPTDDSNFVVGAWSEATVPQDGNPYYFWVTRIGTSEYSGGASANDNLLAFGNTVAGSIEMVSGTSNTQDSWPNFPANDPYHMMVGVVTVQPQLGAVGSGAFPQLLIYQIARNDIEAGFAIHSDGSAETAVPVTTRFRGEYSGSAYYWVGDIVTQTVSYAPKTLINTYLMYPPAATAYQIWDGPITAVDPSIHTPDPWCQIGQSIGGGEGALENGAYDAAKFYVRTL